MKRKIQQRRSLLKHNQSAGVSGAALNPATARMEIPALGIITPQRVPKIMKTPLKQLPNKKNGKMGKLAPMNRP